MSRSRPNSSWTGTLRRETITRCVGGVVFAGRGVFNGIGPEKSAGESCGLAVGVWATLIARDGRESAAWPREGLEAAAPRMHFAEMARVINVRRCCVDAVLRFLRVFYACAPLLFRIARVRVPMQMRVARGLLAH